MRFIHWINNGESITAKTVLLIISGAISIVLWHVGVLIGYECWGEEVWVPAQGDTSDWVYWLSNSMSYFGCGVDIVFRLAAVAFFLIAVFQLRKAIKRRFRRES